MTLVPKAPDRSGRPEYIGLAECLWEDLMIWSLMFTKDGKNDTQVEQRKDDHEGLQILIRIRRRWLLQLCNKVVDYFSKEKPMSLQEWPEYATTAQKILEEDARMHEEEPGNDLPVERNAGDAATLARIAIRRREQLLDLCEQIMAIHAKR